MVIESKSAGQTRQIQLRGYIQSPMCKLLEARDKTEADEEPEDQSAPDFAIAEHLYKVLRGSNNLVFPNSRTQVESYADRLRRCCERDAVPNEFWPHHGSLSKDLSEQSEQALKSGEDPATGICTSTLELGIDIGSIKNVVQIGSPPSVASLRQRLGRSGRRPGEPAILRAYCKEQPLDTNSTLSDQLRQGLVQTIAMIRLLTQSWFEPPRTQGVHASTLVQQCLSIIAQCGGATAPELWRRLVADGAFTRTEKADFVELLKSLGAKELISQESSGLLLPGAIGERLVNHYEFYSAFTSDEEFRLVCAGKPLGSVPVSRPLTKDQRIIFGGRRWQVQDVDLEAKVIVVSPSRGGAPPYFEGLGAMIHDRVRQEMRAVLTEKTPCPFIDRTAQALLDEARQTFAALGLAEQHIIKKGSSCQIVSWLGDRANDALCLLLNHAGVSCGSEGLLISTNADSDKLMHALGRVAALDASDLKTLLANVENMQREKWDWALPESLLMKSFASISLDIETAIGFAKAQAQ